MKTVVIVAVIIVLLYLLMLYLISPGNYKKCYPYDWLYKSYIAHRGIYNNEQNVIENTSEAFINAIYKGYNIETDVVPYSPENPYSSSNKYKDATCGYYCEFIEHLYYNTKKLKCQQKGENK